MNRLSIVTRGVAVLAISLCLAAAAAAQPSLVSYQGQLEAAGAPFTGNAQFKFVVLCGTTSAWSNDGTSTNGSEPSAAVTLPVDQGLFSVLLGDPALSMVALTAGRVADCSSPKLRLWVDTGGGFEQLSDQPLASSPFALKATYAQAAVGFTIPGLGKLVVQQRKARKGRNPKTGETIKIAAKKVLKFRIAKAAKDAITPAKAAK